MAIEAIASSAVQFAIYCQTKVRIFVYEEIKNFQIVPWKLLRFLI